jgi:hypothetical protein
MRTVLLREHSIKDNRKTPIMASKEAARYQNSPDQPGKKFNSNDRTKRILQQTQAGYSIQEPAIRYDKLVNEPAASSIAKIQWLQL